MSLKQIVLTSAAAAAAVAGFAMRAPAQITVTEYTARTPGAAIPNADFYVGTPGTPGNDIVYNATDLRATPLGPLTPAQQGQLLGAGLNTRAYTGIASTSGGSPTAGFTDSFGLEFTGYLNVTSALVGTSLTFTSNSDDGSILRVNGTKVVLNGGPHAFPGPDPTGTYTFAAPGLYAFDLRYAETNHGPGVEQLILPRGVTIAAVPEPSQTAALGLGALGALALMAGARRRRAAA